MSAVMDSDGWVHFDRADLMTLDQVQAVLGERWEEFARDVAGGVVASTLAVLTASGARPVAVTSGAVADWLHGRLPATVVPGQGACITEVPAASTSVMEAEGTVKTATEAPYGEVEKLLACLRVDVARWAAQERIDDGVAADLGYYLGEVQKVAEDLENRVDEVGR